MIEDVDFEILLAAAKSGDESAMQALIRQYEPELRIVARSRLSPLLRPHLDTIDLVQSVHRSLLIGLRNNQFDIASPEKLLGLAVTIVRRKAAKQWRKLKREQRISHNGLAQADSETSNKEEWIELLLSQTKSEADPSIEVAMRELTQNWLRQLEPIEKQLIQLRMEGYSNVEIARLTDQDPDVLRVRLSRLRKRLRERGIVEQIL